MTSQHDDSGSSDSSDSLYLGETRVGDLDDFDSIAIGPDIRMEPADLDWPEDEEFVRLDSRYELQNEIGHGNMGTVLRAIDRRLKRLVAIKRMKKELANDRQFVRRFQTEARVIAAVNHRNIVQVYDFGWDEDGPYIVMELVEGENLPKWIPNTGGVKLSTAVDLTIQICDALSTAHDRGIIHRDIKPGNILISQSGIPKLVDFGLARFDEAHLGQTREKTAMGTPQFMSPEQWRDASRVDHRSDLWSLAGTLYWILTGNVPRVIHPNRIPELIRPVLLKALESGPDQRYQSAGEFGQALQSVLTAMKRGERPEELLPGKCPVCTYLNDMAKKFCESCGAALREPCLDCHQPVEVWARFCGDCGVNVGAALERRLEQLEAEKHQIESFERSYRHADAILRAEQLAKIDHPRLTGYAEWAAEALKKLRSELKSLESDRDRLLSEAGQHFANYQYGDAEHFLEQIPEPLRIGRSNDLLQVSRRRHAECWKLSSEIRGALSTRSYEGLLPKLMKFSELRPNDEVARELRTKLETKELTHAINSAVADKKFDGLLPKVERYLQLRPADEGAQILSLRLGRIENRSLTNGIGLKLVRIPLGEFLMGAGDSDSSADVNDKPQHPIEITKPFYMSVYEVTQGQFEMVMERNPSEFSGRPGEDAVRLPVENVTWDEAVEFCRRLSERPEEKSAGRLYRLPTEAEWEYACRAGTTTLFHVGDALSSTQANFDGTYPHGGAAIGPYLDATSVVGSYEPNGFGLYDVHGNVYEWCADWFDEEFYRQSPSSDPSGPFSGTERVARGGSLCGTATNCRSSDRNSYEPEIRSPYCGFRVACVLDSSAS